MFENSVFIIILKENKGSAKYFLLGNAKKKILNILSNFFFYLKVQSFRLIMENNFIQMAASAGHSVAYTIGSIFKCIIDCMQLHFTNGFTNIVLACRRNTYLRRQHTNNSPTVAAPSWLNVISSSADNAIFKNRLKTIETKCCQYTPLQFL